MAGSNRSIWTQRSIVLASLGYPDYETYLESDRWALIRGQVLARDRYLCGCGKKATQVHHRKYDEATLLGETLDYMVAICAPCHRFGSVDHDGRLTTPEEADRRIDALQSSRGDRAVLAKKTAAIRRGAVTPRPGPPKHCPTCHCWKQHKKAKAKKWRKELARLQQQQPTVGPKHVPKQPSQPTPPKAPGKMPPIKWPKEVHIPPGWDD